MRFLIIAVISFIGSQAFAQDILYARTVLNKLCSKDFAGRGYVNNGDAKAANYIKEQYQGLGVLPFDSSYFQSFSFDVNTFPKEMRIRLDETVLKTGIDFIIHPESPSVHKDFDVVYINHALIYKKKKWNKTLAKANRNQVWVLDKEGADANSTRIIKDLWTNPGEIGAVIRLETTKLTWSVGRRQSLIPAATVLSSAWPKDTKQIRLDIDSEFKNHTANNVIGYIPGTEKTDSFIVFSAHYDHLGMMGENTYFPGANDNASGTSMVLQLAKYFSQHPSKYSIAFMCFAGEEAGLLGSFQYANAPLFPLNQIRFVVNMDIFGTGDEGITVVNAKAHQSEFDLLKGINEDQQFLKKVKARGQTQNSDHYPFSAKGVPAYFIYTMGGIKAYHDVYDKAETLPLDAYENLFKLIRDFSIQIQ